MAWVTGKGGPLEELINLAEALPAKMNIVEVNSGNLGTDNPEWENVPEKMLQALKDQILNQDEKITLNVEGIFIDGSKSSKTILTSL